MLITDIIQRIGLNEKRIRKKKQKQFFEVNTVQSVQNSENAVQFISVICFDFFLHRPVEHRLIRVDFVIATVGRWGKANPSHLFNPIL